MRIIPRGASTLSLLLSSQTVPAELAGLQMRTKLFKAKDRDGPGDKSHTNGAQVKLTVMTTPWEKFLGNSNSCPVSLIQQKERLGRKRTETLNRPITMSNPFLNLANWLLIAPLDLKRTARIWITDTSRPTQDYSTFGC